MKDYKNFVERMVSFDDEIDITNTELYHFGIKGMRWGIRKANTDNHQTKNVKKKTTKSSVNNGKDIASQLLAGVVGGMTLSHVASYLGYNNTLGSDLALKFIGSSIGSSAIGTLIRKNKNK